jgi:hypothetical protein
MPAIALETEIVGSRFDPQTRTCYYTIERNGQRWTAAIPADAFSKHKTKQAKRNHLATALTMAMRGAPDSVNKPALKAANVDTAKS